MQITCPTKNLYLEHIKRYRFFCKTTWHTYFPSSLPKGLPFGTAKEIILKKHISEKKFFHGVICSNKKFGMQSNFPAQVEGFMTSRHASTQRNTGCH